MKKFIVGLISLLFLSAPLVAVGGNPNLPLSFSGIWSGQQNYVVEQQSDQHWPPDPLRYDPNWLHYVVNHFTECKWNGDDNADIIQVNRVLKAGQTASGDYCIIAQSNSNFVCINNDCEQWSFSEAEAIGFRVYSKSNSLIVKLTWMPQNKVFDLLPVWDKVSKLYFYGGVCVGINYLKDDSALYFIQGSNGSTDPNSIDGRGVKTTITPSIINPTGRDIKDIAYTLTALGASQPTGNVCTRGAPAYTTHITEYPFKWYIP